jgi:hypothetical protein
MFILVLPLAGIGAVLSGGAAAGGLLGGLFNKGPKGFHFPAIPPSLREKLMQQMLMFGGGDTDALFESIRGMKGKKGDYKKIFKKLFEKGLNPGQEQGDLREFGNESLFRIMEQMTGGGEFGGETDLELLRGITGEDRDLRNKFLMEPGQQIIDPRVTDMAKSLVEGELDIRLDDINSGDTNDKLNETFANFIGSSEARGLSKLSSPNFFGATEVEKQRGRLVDQAKKEAATKQTQIMLDTLKEDKGNSLTAANILNQSSTSAAGNLSSQGGVMAKLMEIALGAQGQGFDQTMSIQEFLTNLRNNRQKVAAAQSGASAGQQISL